MLLFVNGTGSKLVCDMHTYDTSTPVSGTCTIQGQRMEELAARTDTTVLVAIEYISYANE